MLRTPIPAHLWLSTTDTVCFVGAEDPTQLLYLASQQCSCARIMCRFHGFITVYRRACSKADCTREQQKVRRPARWMTRRGIPWVVARAEEGFYFTYWTVRMVPFQQPGTVGGTFSRLQEGTPRLRHEQKGCLFQTLEDCSVTTGVIGKSKESGSSRTEAQSSGPYSEGTLPTGKGWGHFQQRRAASGGRTRVHPGCGTSRRVCPGDNEGGDPGEKGVGPAGTTKVRCGPGGKRRCQQNGHCCWQN
jgi:hypothetical protein